MTLLEVQIMGGIKIKVLLLVIVLIQTGDEPFLAWQLLLLICMCLPELWYCACVALSSTAQVNFLLLGPSGCSENMCI